MDPKRLSRRSLLSWFLGGSFVAFFGDLLYDLGKFLRPPSELIGGGGGGKQTVIAMADLPPDHSKVVRVAGKLVIVCHLGNQVYALSAVCTHLGCIVHWKDKGDQGMNMGNNLHCACHDAYFDLKTGRVLGGPAPRPLQTYPVKIANGQIVIGEA